MFDNYKWSIFSKKKNVNFHWPNNMNYKTKKNAFIGGLDETMTSDSYKVASIFLNFKT
jgi:hypothetical protein